MRPPICRPFALAFLLVPALLGSQEPQPPAATVDQVVRELTAGGPEQVLSGLVKFEAVGREAVPQLEKQLASPDPKVRLAAAGALCGLGIPEKGAPVLEDLALTGEPPALRDAALAALGRIGSAPQIQSLDRLVDRATDLPFKVKAASALWRASRSPKAAVALREGLTSPEIGVRRTAALTLAETGLLEEVQPQVEEIAKEPGVEGQLARALLAQDRLARLVAAKADPKLLGKEKVIEEMVDKARRHFVDEGKTGLDTLMEAAARGVASGLDRHTEYLSPEEVQARQEMFRGEYFGIGAQVQKDELGYVLIETAFFDGPAYKAGLRAGDRIIKVFGEPVQELTLTETVKKLRGPADTPVKIQVLRVGWQETQDMSLLRGPISRDSVYSMMLPGQVGYIRLLQFGERTDTETHQAIKALLKQGMKGLLLDLRANGGGLLDTSVAIAGKFLPQGSLIVYTEGRSREYGARVEYHAGGGYYEVQGRGPDGQQRRFVEWINPDEARKRGFEMPAHEIYPSFPAVVLTDKATASASEILSGALQQHGRATVVGTVTYGKGSVQREIPLEASRRVEGGKIEEARFKMTIAKYYLKDGNSIHGVGIKPDVHAAMEEVEGWKFATVRELTQKGAFKRYIDKQFQGNKEKFTKLVQALNVDPADYPGFDEWYGSLEVKLPRDDAARFLRLNLRERVVNEQGKPFALEYPLGEDLPLQRGVFELAKKLQLDLSSLPEYRLYRDRFKEEDQMAAEQASKVNPGR